MSQLSICTFCLLYFILLWRVCLFFVVVPGSKYAMTVWVTIYGWAKYDLPLITVCKHWPWKQSLPQKVVSTTRSSNTDRRLGSHRSLWKVVQKPIVLCSWFVFQGDPDQKPETINMPRLPKVQWIYLDSLCGSPTSSGLFHPVVSILKRSTFLTDCGSYLSQ